MSAKQPYESILLAIDSSFLPEQKTLQLDQLAEENCIGGAKIGLEAITAGLHVDLRQYADHYNLRNMEDWKLACTPVSVGRAVANIAERGAWGITVKVDSGIETLRAAVANRGESHIIGVSVLTSIGENECNRIFGRVPRAQVCHCTSMLLEAGAQAVVCSGQELDIVRKVAGDKLIAITPGIRESGSPPDDQRRTMTAADAISAGADYLAIGRPILAAPDPLAAARRFVEEIARAQANRSMV